MHCGHAPFYVYKCTQEGAWSMHISKFFCLLLIHSDTYSMYAWCIILCIKVYLSGYQYYIRMYTLAVLSGIILKTKINLVAGIQRCHLYLSAQKGQN